MTGPGELPIAVIDTDVGGVAARWTFRDANGATLSCDELLTTKVWIDVAVDVDGEKTGFYCENGAGMQTGIVSPLAPGTHTVVVEARDTMGWHVSSMPVDVDVAVGTVAEVLVDFQL